MGFVVILFLPEKALMQHRFAKVFALTFMPTVLGWLSLNGFTLVWRVLLHTRRQRVSIGLFWILGFTGLCLVLSSVFAILWVFSRYN